MTPTRNARRRVMHVPDLVTPSPRTSMFHVKHLHELAQHRWVISAALKYRARSGGERPGADRSGREEDRGCLLAGRCRTRMLVETGAPVSTRDAKSDDHEFSRRGLRSAKADGKRIALDCETDTMSGERCGTSPRSVQTTRERFRGCPGDLPITVRMPGSSRTLKDSRALGCSGCVGQEPSNRASARWCTTGFTVGAFRHDHPAWGGGTERGGGKNRRPAECHDERCVIAGSSAAGTPGRESCWPDIDDRECSRSGSGAMTSGEEILVV